MILYFNLNDITILEKVTEKKLLYTQIHGLGIQAEQVTTSIVSNQLNPKVKNLRFFKKIGLN